MDENLKHPYFFTSSAIQSLGAGKPVLLLNGDLWQLWSIYDCLSNMEPFLPWMMQMRDGKYKTAANLLQLVIDSWSSQVVNPRDKIFSFLGAVPNAEAHGLVADYSLSVEQMHACISLLLIDWTR